MTVMTTNVEMPHDDGLENSFRVSSIVANVTAVATKRATTFIHCIYWNRKTHCTICYWRLITRI